MCYYNAHPFRGTLLQPNGLLVGKLEERTWKVAKALDTVTGEKISPADE